MFGLHHNRRIAAAAVALALAIVPCVTRAQDLPSYAQPAVVSTDETIHGRIAAVTGAFNITVNDDRGFVDNVELHQGTIINPTGLALSSGMSVTIAGYNAGAVFTANEIDTPYTYAGALPTPVYYGPGYWCPGFAYGFGPSFSLAFIVGGDDDRFEHRPFYGRAWDGHQYFGDYAGRSGGSRGFGGESRSTRVDGATDLRSPGRREIGGERRVPPAFAGRTFAGSAAANPSHSTTGAAFGHDRSYRTQPTAPGSPSIARWSDRTGGERSAPAVRYTPAVRYAPAVRSAPAERYAPAVRYAPAERAAPAVQAAPAVRFENSGAPGGLARPPIPAGGHPGVAAHAGSGIQR